MKLVSFFLMNVRAKETCSMPSNEYAYSLSSASLQTGYKFDESSSS